MNIITTEQALAELVEAYRGADFAWDVETVGQDRLNHRTNQVTWLSMATHGRVDVIPMGHPNGEFIRWDKPLLATGKERQAKGKELREQDYSQVKTKWVAVFTDPPEQLLPSQVWPVLSPLFSDPETIKIAHNLRFDAKAVAKYLGYVPRPPYWDTMVTGWVLEPGNEKGLDQMLARTFGYEMVKGIGKMVEVHSFSDVAKYAALDARWTWLLAHRQSDLLDERKVHDIFDLEMDTLQVIIDMEMHGVRIDTDALYPLKERLTAQLNADRIAVFEAAGREFSINSNADKQEILFGSKKDGGQGLRSVKTTPSGNPSVDASVLERLKSNPVAASLLKYQETSKLLSTYVTAYTGGEVERTTNGKTRLVKVPSLLQDGRIYGSFHQTGAETGRMSCVAGSTVLRTNRGDFTFAEYLPQEDDCVVTHTGRWMRVLRKIYKGRDFMLRVRTHGGAELVCTEDHRLLTPSGWMRVGDLVVGSEVRCVSQQAVCEQPGQRRGGSGDVQGQGQADPGHYGREVGYHYPERAAHLEVSSSEGGVRSGEVTATVSVEDGDQEPDAGQEWFPAPQLHRGHRGRSRVLDAEGGWSVRAGSSDRDGRGPGVGATRTSSITTCSSHRRGQAEQLLGQPRPGDSCWASDVAHDDRVVEVSFVGAMGVWDIEVEGDHSYCAGGFLNHNSSSPNLQNVPNASTDNGRAIRNLFVPDPGHRFIVADFAQIEPRIIASLSNDKRMIQAFLDGEDIYTAVAEPLGVNRAAGKQLVLSIAYGIGPDSVSERLGIKVTDAKKLMTDFAKEFPSIETLRRKTIVSARSKRPPTVRTFYGRMRHLPDLTHEDVYLRARAERQAFNAVIQGSAADIMKKALVRTYDLLPHGSHIVMTVHDEIIVTAPEADVDLSSKAVREGMTGITDFKVPLEIDLKVVDRWGDAK